MSFFSFLSLKLIYLSLRSDPVPAVERDPHSMMLPCPWFTLGMVLGSRWAVPSFHRGLEYRLKCVWGQRIFSLKYLAYNKCFFILLPLRSRWWSHFDLIVHLAASSLLYRGLLKLRKSADGLLNLSTSRPVADCGQTERTLGAAKLLLFNNNGGCCAPADVQQFRKDFLFLHSSVS